MFQKKTKMVWGHDHRPSYNYQHHSSPRGVYSYSPQFWRHSHPQAAVVVSDRRNAREADAAMRTAVYVGAGALGIVGVGALIWLIAKK